MYKIIVYIPESHLEAVKTAMFTAGAGQYPGDCYDHCSWQVLGEGQFRPIHDANPTIGQIGEITRVPEWRVEMVAPREKIQAIMAACKQAHPYEVVAYDIYQLIQLEDL